MTRFLSTASTLAFVLVLAACGNPPADEPPQADEDTAEVSPPADADTAPARDTTPPADTVEEAERTLTRFYVHLRPGVDPEAFARRHDLEPTDVITGPRPGLVAPLTAEEEEALRADTLVRSLAREIHGGEGVDRPPLRPLRGDSTSP